MNITVRAATPEDLEDLATLWHAGWRDAHLAIVPAELARLRTRDRFRSRLEAGLEQVRVLPDVDDRPVAFYMVRDDELYQFYVDSRARGTGVAQALMEDAEARFRERSVSLAWLTCAIGNDRAARFYEKMGWQRARSFIDRLETPDGHFLHRLPDVDVDVDLRRRRLRPVRQLVDDAAKGQRICRASAAECESGPPHPAQRRAVVDIPPQKYRASVAECVRRTMYG